MLKNPIKHIAESDIECWVIINNGNLETPWKKVDRISTICDGKYAYLGIYSFKYKLEAERFESLLKRENIQIKEAIIPKGSEYYEGLLGYSFPVAKEHMTVTKFCSKEIKIKE